jgi:hypothetical protein
MLRVVEAFAWPMIEETVRMSTPEARSVVAAVWRTSWSRVVEMPAFLAMRSKAQVAVIGVMERPSSLGKTSLQHFPEGFELAVDRLFALQSSVFNFGLASGKSINRLA